VEAEAPDEPVTEDAPAEAGIPAEAEVQG